MNTLDVGAYDPITDTIVIEGTRYAAFVFRGPLGIKGMVGDEFRVIERGGLDGEIVTVQRFPPVGKSVIELLAHAIERADAWHDECWGGKVKDDYMLDIGRKLLSELAHNPGAYNE